MNIIIRTEERPKKSTLAEVLNITFAQKGYCTNLNKDNIEIKPLFISQGDIFSFKYEITLVNTKEVIQSITKILLDIVSGSTSFIDYLVFEDDELIAMIEETKTDDSESRNTGVYQRASKFVYANMCFPNILKYMLYTSESSENIKPSDTAIFGSKLLKTIGVKLVGKSDYYNELTSFRSIEEIIEFKNNMRRPPASNVPILITKSDNSYSISGTLAKPVADGNIAHDPNIGALTLIAAGIRTFDKETPIYITKHSVNQSYIERARGNKFLYISSFLNIKLYGLDYNHLSFTNLSQENYYRIENSSEKVTTIFLHILLENNGAKLIYENHAGCERGYFYTPSGLTLALPKRVEGQQLYIPDLVLELPDDIIWVIEGKKLSTLMNGVRELDNYDLLENEYIKKYYNPTEIERWVTTFGGNLTAIPHEKVLMHINNNGKILINSKAFDGLLDALYK